ncbi:hypothetical protein FS842_009076 [Serendipita sp. 407]|nr:hypothetical protein FS842_009076 [Serendipita sp. 407]
MSESFQPWILEDLRDYAIDHGDFMSRKLAGRARKCQLADFMTSRTENPEATIWAMLADKHHLIPACFDPKETTRFEQKQKKALTSLKGAIMILKEITVRRERVPLRQGGLSPEDFLVLHIGGIEQLGAEGEPLFRIRVVENGITKTIDQLKPLGEEPEMKKWLEGLRIGNGRVLQLEHIERKRAPGKVARPPASPSKDIRQMVPSRTIKKRPLVENRWGKTIDFDRKGEWIIPEDQLRLIEATKESALPAGWFEDDTVEDEINLQDTPVITKTTPKVSVTPRKEVHNDDICSPASDTFSGWGESSDFAESPPPTSHRGEDDLNGEEDAGDETSASIKDEVDVPCGQVPRVFSSSTFLPTQISAFYDNKNTDSSEEEVLAGVSVASSESAESTPRRHAFGPIFGSLPGVSHLEDSIVEPNQPKETQLTSFTIQPTSSNEVSYSSKIPLGQQVLRNRSSLIPYSDTSNNDSEDSQSSVASQLSQIGDDLYESSELGEPDTALEGSTLASIIPPLTELIPRDPSPSKRPEPRHRHQQPQSQDHLMTVSPSNPFSLAPMTLKRSVGPTFERRSSDMEISSQAPHQVPQASLSSGTGNRSMKSRGSKRQRDEYDIDSTPPSRKPKKHNPSEWFSPKSLERVKRDKKNGKSVSTFASTKPKQSLLGGADSVRRPRSSLTPSQSFGLISQRSSYADYSQDYPRGDDR